MNNKILLIAALVFMATLAIGQPADIQDNNESITFEKVTGEIQNPWGMTWLPNGDMLVTDKKGELRVIRDGKLLAEKVEGLPEIYVRGQGGLMDIEVHPQFEQNRWLYLSYASGPGGNGGGNTTIARFKFQDNRLTNKEELYKAEPNTRKGQHFGSRLEFDREGYLYFSVGDRGNRDVNPQDVTRDNGKIYRIHDDGTVPESNPFSDRRGAKKAIYSYGHRNPQGLAMDPNTGKIWEHEHGPQGGDEINLIEAGKNYGWPVISYGINYDGSEFAEATARRGMKQPISYYVPSIAPCGMTFIEGDRYPGWSGDLILGSLKFLYLVHAKVEGDRIVMQEKVAEGIGRVRSVEQGPDDYLYVGIEGQGIFRLLVKG